MQDDKRDRLIGTAFLVLLGLLVVSVVGLLVRDCL